VIVITHGDKEENTPIDAKNQSNLQTYTTFKIISSQPPNSKTGMKMWRSETIASGANRRTAARIGCEKSICNVGFQIARVAFDRAGPSLACDFSVHAPDESVEFLLCHSVLLKGIVVRMNGDRSQCDDFVAMQNTNVFTIGRAFQQ
jgi:hypothetical protein